MTLLNSKSLRTSSITEELRHLVAFLTAKVSGEADEWPVFFSIFNYMQSCVRVGTDSALDWEGL